MPDIAKINAVAIADIEKVDGILAANIEKVNGLVFSTAPAFVGLLDTYTGAAGAYSVRRLSGSYTGACMRVREDGGNTEADIGFDANGDLDTTAIASHCGANNGYVRYWYDQSTAGGTGSGNDAGQATGDNQPKIYDSSTGLIEEGSVGFEKPALDFVNASQQYLLSGNFSFADTDLTATAVAKATNNPAGVWSLMYSYRNSGILFRRQNSGSGGIFFLDTLGSESGQGFSNDMTDQSLHFTHHVSNSLKHHLNGSQVLSASDTFAVGNLPAYIGSGVPPIAARYLTGTYQELIFWNEDYLSDRSAIETDINDYFDIY